jgi:hypothetical protein
VPLAAQRRRLCNDRELPAPSAWVRPTHSTELVSFTRQRFLFTGRPAQTRPAPWDTTVLPLANTKAKPIADGDSPNLSLSEERYR